MSRREPELSLVVPAHDEEGNVAPLVEAVARALAGRDYELVLVDDESTDGTRAAMLEAAAADSRVRVIAKTNRQGKSTRGRNANPLTSRFGERSRSGQRRDSASTFRPARRSQLQKSGPRGELGETARTPRLRCSCPSTSPTRRASNRCSSGT